MNYETKVDIVMALAFAALIAIIVIIVAEIIAFDNEQVVVLPHTDCQK